MSLGVPAGHGGEFRNPKLFFGMIGKEYTRHHTVGEHYRAQLDKSRFLRFVTVLIAAGGVPRHGVKRKQVRETTHLELARMMGYAQRQSFTRNALRAPRLVRCLKKFAKGSLYRFVFGEGQSTFGPESFTMPTSAEMKANEHWGDYWANARKQYGGYSWTPGWIFHPNAPGKRHDRLVLAALAYYDLFKLDPKTGRCKGEIQVTQEAIASLLGISVDTVAAALRFWSKLGLLQVVEQPGCWEIGGKVVPAGTPGATWKQPPNKIFYLPAREFTHELAVGEFDRLLRAARARQVERSAWWNLIESITRDTLAQWRGTRRRLATFREECSRLLRDRNVPVDLISYLFPRPPD